MDLQLSQLCKPRMSAIPRNLHVFLTGEISSTLATPKQARKMPPQRDDGPAGNTGRRTA